MKIRSNKYLVVAIILALLFHGTSMFFTMEQTYDALIHVFFGSHYAEHWFDTWNESWYTGFTVLGYPPLVHQAIALLSFIGGLKFGMFTLVIIGTLLFVTGVYRYALLITANRTVAGYAALISVFSSSFVETLHLFGQLPSIIGISVLMHALPEIYLWLKTGRIWHLITSLSLLAVTVTSHHVTPIFGMVFFIFPLIGMVLMDNSFEKAGTWKQVTLKIFVGRFRNHFKRILVFGIGALVLIVVCILPYWINTKNNPITQVPIPHGSRDNFLEITSSGLVFFLIPWGVLLIVLPYIFYRYFSKRYLFFGLSFSLLLLLGTGGTTPLPKMILGDNAFNILTLDRFTLWASIMALPIFGEFLYRFAEGDLKQYLQKKYSPVYHRLSGAILAAVFLFMTGFTMSLGYFRPSQPEQINMQPLVNFLNQDQHYKWRYLPLGFGDQMAWLSAQTKASTIDGNYHSARRLPELTSRAVERLENSKFRGVEGLGSLQQFLAVPEKYHLKYIFSNDKFYDPLLYFSGWHRLQRLENGIVVWEKEGVSPLPSRVARDDIPVYQALMWGTIPLFTVFIVLLLNLRSLWQRTLKTRQAVAPSYMSFKLALESYPKKLLPFSRFWTYALSVLIIFGCIQFYLTNSDQISPENAVEAYYDALDFKAFEKSYSLLNPNSDKSLDQFMLEISVSDGLLSSYSKLDAITTNLASEQGDRAVVSTKLSWVTPLKKFEQHIDHSLQRIEGKWYLDPLEYETDIPADQLFTTSQTTYSNHGRRRISSEQTYHEDVLKQPLVSVLNAKLVALNDTYHIVGELQNMDNIPADISIKATLYSRNNKILASFNARDLMKHKLLPKERTAFRVDFEEYLWDEDTSPLPVTFDPSQFTNARIADAPATFELQIEANVATKDLRDYIAVSDLVISQDSIEGILYNTGSKDATITQLLISHLDEKGKTSWVEQRYISESIRSHRKQRFSLDIHPVQTTLVSSDMNNVFVNGHPNTQVWDIWLSDREFASDQNSNTKKDRGASKYMLKLNYFVANAL
ncbi:hypothetical protein J1N09_02045 [Aureitalea sp. L0-47]|nr:hypothetical protein [Aureitalea sp. L0-47]